jgi:hypothetical protein
LQLRGACAGASSSPASFSRAYCAAPDEDEERFLATGLWITRNVLG